MSQQSYSSPKGRISLVVSKTSGGGAEKSMAEIAQYLRSKGFAVQILSINQSERLVGLLHEDDLCLGRDPKAPLKDFFSLFLRFRKELRGFNPQLVVLNCEVAEFFGVFSPAGRVIVVEHTTRPWAGRRIMGVFVRLILKMRRAEWITVVKHQEYSWPFLQRCTFIPNPVLEPQGLAAVSADLVFVGRLTRSKHPEFLVNISSAIGCSVDFFGDGVLLEELKRHSSAKLKFWGFVQQPWHYIGVDSVAVFPSEYEGDGRGVVEAILRGNPVLLRDNSDFRRFNLPNQHYFNDASDLKRKVRDALDRNLDSYRVVETMRKEIRMERSIDRVGSQWITHAFGKRIL